MTADPRERFHVIVAGNHGQASYHAKTHGWKATEWRYVTRLEQIIGLDRGMRVFLAGTYYERSDWPEIEREITIRDYQREYLG